MSGLPRDRGSGDGRERVVAQFFEDVVAAFEQLALEREAAAFPAEPGAQWLVIAAVGAGGESGALRRFVHRPAERWRSLAGEVSGGAVIVGLVDGEVQAAIPGDVAGVLKAADIAELGEDRDRGQRAHSVDLVDQRAAARLFARDRVQLRIERDELEVERVDDRKRDVELLAGGGRKR